MNHIEYDVDFDEFAEVDLGDLDMDIDYDMGLEIPDNFDFTQFLQPI
jgi:hypothetical protein